jgi:hypothetical protein
MRSEVEQLSPFHAGEQAVQERLGVRESIEPWARKVVRPYLPEEHRAFYAALPFLVAAARDESGRPWATILAGAPGFASSPDPETLVIQAEPVLGDALHGRIIPGADVGLLGIDLATRRRNRLNGRIRTGDRPGITLAVGQSFGNCPQYISERQWQHVPPEQARSSSRRFERITAAVAERIRAADTFFIATGHHEDAESATSGMDASHRGGPPGFVEVVDDRTLVFPDYAGNNHFNTIGNLVMDPRAGLLFVDFETGGMLQLTGRVQIDWDSSELERHPGAHRLLRFTLEAAILLESALPLRWSTAAESLRELRLIRRTRESADVVSFEFEAEDGEPLAEFVAGQHLPIAVDLPDQDAPARRTYSLSNSPGDRHYRISVKRDARGLVSQYLHDTLEVGSTLTAHAPAGQFTLEHGQGAVILISAGIGVTPMVGMLHELVQSAQPRPVWFVHGARDGEHHALAREVRTLADQSELVTTHVSFSNPLPADRKGSDFDTQGRVTGAVISSLLPSIDADFYLCGPIPFMASLQADLEALGVAPDRIHTESFGPAGGAEPA